MREHLFEPTGRPVDDTKRFQELYDDLYGFPGGDGPGGTITVRGDVELGYFIDTTTGEEIPGKAVTAKLTEQPDADGFFASVIGARQLFLRPAALNSTELIVDHEARPIVIQGDGKAVIRRAAMPAGPPLPGRIREYLDANFLAIEATKVDLAAATAGPAADCSGPLADIPSTRRHDIFRAQFRSHVCANLAGADRDEMLALLQSAAIELRDWDLIRRTFYFQTAMTSAIDERTLYDAPVDSRPIRLVGLVLDGNSELYEKGGWRAQAFQHQQNHILHIAGAGHRFDLNAPVPEEIAGLDENRGRIQFECSKCVFQNGFADGILIGWDVRARFEAIRAVNLFRGGIQITGPGSHVTVDGYEGRAGKTFLSPLRIEVDTTRTPPIFAEFTNCETHNFSMKVSRGSFVRCRNLRSIGSPGFENRQSRLECIDSTFELSATNAVGAYAARLSGGQASFTNCRFIAKNNPAHTTPAAALIAVQFDSRLARYDQSCLFKNCRFENSTDFDVEAGVQLGDRQGFELGLGAHALRLEDCGISGRLLHGFRMFGGTAELVDSFFELEDEAFALAFFSDRRWQTPGRLLVRSIKFAAIGRYLLMATANPRCSITHEKVSLDRDQNVIKLPPQFHSPIEAARARFLGGRTIRAEPGDDPNALKQGGLPGDEFVQVSPSPNIAVRSWRCKRLYYSDTPFPAGDPPWEEI